MANTFSTSLMPNILAGALSTLREEAVMISAVTKNFDGAAGQIGQTVNVAVPQVLTTSTVTPAAVPTIPSDLAPGVKSITINQWKKANFYLTSQDVRVIQSGVIVPMQMREAVRALVKQVNSDLLGLYKKVSSYAGTAGTNLFNSNVNTVASVKAQLDRTFCPDENRFLMIGLTEQTTALQLTDYKTMMNAGDNQAFRRGALGDLYGFTVKRDQQIPTHTTGAAAGYLVNNGAGYPAGTTVLVIDTGTGAWVDGDVVSFAGHATTYAVKNAAAESTTTQLTLYKALEQAVADNEAITKKATHVVNLGFDPTGFGLVMRTPGDAIEGAPTLGLKEVMTDPVSGIPMALRFIPGYELAMFELQIMYGFELLDDRRISRAVS